VVLALSTNIWYFCTNQTIVQSCLGAKSRWDGKMGIILLGFLMILTGLSVEFPGLVAYALNPSLEKADQAYPFVVTTLVSTGLKGLVLAGMCGAVMSTVEALMHSSSAIFTMDLYTKFVKNVPDNKLISVGRWASAIILLVGTLWAPIVQKFPDIFSFFQRCWFFIAAPVAAVFLLAVLWKHATRAAAFWGLLLVLPLFALPYAILFAEGHWGFELNDFNLAGWVFAFSLVFVALISVFTQPPRAEQVEGLVWRPKVMRLPEAELANYKWYKNLWLWCAIWVGVMVAIYIKFW
jgi:SSS family solute:Na+ symporter